MVVQLSRLSVTESEELQSFIISFPEMFIRLRQQNLTQANFNTMLILNGHPEQRKRTNAQRSIKSLRRLSRDSQIFLSFTTFGKNRDSLFFPNVVNDKNICESLDSFWIVGLGASARHLQKST